MPDLEVVLPEQSTENENASAETISAILGSGKDDKRTLEIAEIIARHDRPTPNSSKPRGKPDGTIFKASEAVPHPNRFNIPASQLERLKQEHNHFCIGQDINRWPLCLFCRYVPLKKSGQERAKNFIQKRIPYGEGFYTGIYVGNRKSIMLGKYMSRGEMGFAKTLAYQALGLRIPDRFTDYYAEEIPTVSPERCEEIKVQVLYYLQRQKWDRTKNANKTNSARPEQGCSIQPSDATDGGLSQKHKSDRTPALC